VYEVDELLKVWEEKPVLEPNVKPELLVDDWSQEPWQGVKVVKEKEMNEVVFIG
jgi:hypothetical protein